MPTLSESLSFLAREVRAFASPGFEEATPGHTNATLRNAAREMDEAARLLAPFEQPEQPDVERQVLPFPYSEWDAMLSVSNLIPDGPKRARWAKGVEGLRDYIQLTDARIRALAFRLRRSLAPFEQPEVAELLKRAGQRERAPQAYRTNGAVLESAKDLRAHAHALGELAEERAKLKRVEGLQEEWLADLGPVPLSPDELERLKCAGQVAAALSDAGREREVTEKWLATRVGDLREAALSDDAALSDAAEIAVESEADDADA